MPTARPSRQAVKTGRSDCRACGCRRPPRGGSPARAEPSQSFPIRFPSSSPPMESGTLLSRELQFSPNASAQPLTSAPSLVVPARPPRQIAHPLEEPGTGSASQERLQGSGGRAEAAEGSWCGAGRLVPRRCRWANTTVFG
ncbi:hypothetical protein AAFF_G00068880 [Aldrovandia affinis]|uniref:Uncharacterized protein n=1 Tax=Aldrovandia affinis TaxID=143900 RepID=A0AAD7WEH3_9TELE|nr:hypothetical protein AAFF_G00068880 [Aldrovandia affinis]